MASTHVLRIRRTDNPSTHLLLNVTATSKTRPLDLKLVATEHEHLYHGSVRSANLASLQSSNFRGDDDEWKSVVAYALLQQRSDVNLDALRGLEIVAAVSGETCTLTLRKNIGGITQRLGSIKLDQDDEREEVSAFEWVDTAVATSDALRTELVTLQESLGSQQSQVAKLTAQLDELVKAKKQHEEDMLRKCAVLLDSKKAKIRDLQSELNHVVKTSSSGTGSRAGHKAGDSARGKRKANSVSPEEEDDLDEGDNDDDLAEEEEDGQRTPERETEDEGSEDGFASPPKQQAPSKATSSQKNDGKASSQNGEQSKKQGFGPEDIPPRRELPFAQRTTRGGGSQEKSKPTPVQQDDDTDDDEL